MQKWEYLYAQGYDDSGIDSLNGKALSARRTDRQSIPDFLREKGEEGWELVSVGRLDFSHTLYLKRPLED